METISRYKDDHDAKAVAHFMIKIGVPIMQPLKGPVRFVYDNHILWSAAHELQLLSDKCAHAYKVGLKSDERLMRMRLILGELSELSAALMKDDEVETTDALADLNYVMCGTAITFDLPWTKAFDEVHKSNMSKDNVVKHEDGVNGKGLNYFKPDLEKVIAIHRGEQ